MQQIEISLKNSDFLKIKDEYGETYYGGNQAWFEQKLAKASACGTVCAAGICAYLAMNNPRYYMLYNYGLDLSKRYYLKHMNELYKYISPIVLFKLPRFLQGKKIFGFYLEEYLSLGIPSVGYLASGLEKFVNSRGVWLRKKVFSDNWSRAKTRDFIREALERDRPVALLNLFNSKLKSIETIRDNGERYLASYDHHWVIITGMTINQSTGKVYLTVSSWGCRAVLDLDDIVSGFSKSMVYFE